MDAGTLVLVNPRASGIRQGGRPCADLDRVCREAGARLLYPNGLEALRAALEEHLLGVEDTGRGCVFLVGGDGTHHHGLTALHWVLRGRPWPRIGLIPAGTVNTTARLWGNGGEPAVVLRRLLASDVTETRPSLRVAEEGGEEHVGFIWGAGLVSRFFERYNQTEGGLLPASVLALRIALGALAGTPLARSVLASSPMRLTLDGQPVSKEYYSLAVTSVHRSVGLGIQVTYRAGEQPDRLHLVASYATPWQLGLQSPRVLLGKPLSRATTVDVLAQEIRVDFLKEGASILDGDWLTARSLTLMVGPSLPAIRGR
ncbi:MAG: diacylglycerol kinase family protein [Myxococcales bacterium]|nr:hypothetical protein [Polyangiaceae bacterium]MDW8248024.1 diacylglycerol kinase family protein [Myxococcales bacterium]